MADMNIQKGHKTPKRITNAWQEKKQPKLTLPRTLAGPKRRLPK